MDRGKDELIDYLVAEAEELKLDTLKVRPKALTIIPGPGSLLSFKEMTDMQKL